MRESYEGTPPPMQLPRSSMMANSDLQDPHDIHIENQNQQKQSKLKKGLKIPVGESYSDNMVQAHYAS